MADQLKPEWELCFLLKSVGQEQDGDWAEVPGGKVFATPVRAGGGAKVGVNISFYPDGTKQ